MGVYVIKMAAKWEGGWQQLLSLCRRRGFITAQQFEKGREPTKNGYLTLGSALKRNITKEWSVLTEGGGRLAALPVAGD